MQNKGKIIETPDLRHIKKVDWELVYEPAEDSFLLLDALEEDLEYIHLQKPGTVLEVGSGSGIIITALKQVLKSTAFCLGVDINEHACKMTKSTSWNNNCPVDVIQGDLISCFKSNSIDLIVFNPPYVVTSNDEMHHGDPLTLSWAGGHNGRKVIDKFLNMVNYVLSERGFGYLLVLKENHPDKIMRKLQEKHWDCQIIARRKIRCEELFVLKFVRTKL